MGKYSGENPPITTEHIIAGMASVTVGALACVFGINYAVSSLTAETPAEAALERVFTHGGSERLEGGDKCPPGAFIIRDPEILRGLSNVTLPPPPKYYGDGTVIYDTHVYGRDGSKVGSVHCGPEVDSTATNSSGVNIIIAERSPAFP